MTERNGTTPAGAERAAPSAVEYDRRFLERSWHWLQEDPEIRTLTLTPTFSREAQEAWFAALPGRPDYVIWGVEFAGVPIGAFGIKNIEGGTGEYWGYLGERTYWGRGFGKWMVGEAVRRGRGLGLASLYLRVSHGNGRAIALYAGQGFERTGEDEHVLVMTRKLA